MTTKVTPEQDTFLRIVAETVNEYVISRGCNTSANVPMELVARVIVEVDAILQTVLIGFMLSQFDGHPTILAEVLKSSTDHYITRCNDVIVKAFLSQLPKGT